MNIREKFLKQKRENAKFEAENEQKKKNRQIWQDELLEKLAHRIEHLLSKHSSKLAKMYQENPELEEDFKRIADKEPPRKISFDDLGGILELLKEQKE